MQIAIIQFFPPATIFLYLIFMAASGCSRISLILLLLIYNFSSMSWTCDAVTDTLRVGENLMYPSSPLLVSAARKFNLDFQVYDNNCYLVIRWMERINDVWNANRDTPIMCPSAALTLDKNNTLKITHKGGDPVVLFSASEESETSSTNSNRNVVATLLDSGNFMLREVIIESVNGSTASTTTTKRVLWQSFDYPTTAFLPGMKLGINYRDGRNWSLSSYFSPHIPATGPFTLEWDPNGCDLKIRRRGVVYWSSGAFRDGKFEFLSPYDESQTLRYIFTSVTNENETYFTYTTTFNQSQKSGWVLTSFGSLVENIGGFIARAENCYGYNTDGAGCQQWGHPIYCRHVGDRFEPKVGYFQPATPDSKKKSDPNANLSISDCKEACWKDCSCMGYDTLFGNKSGCSFFTGKWEFKGQDLSGYSIVLSFLETNSSPTTGTTNNNADRKERMRIIKIIGISIAAALISVVLCIGCYLLRRRAFVHLLGKNRTTKGSELLDFVESDRYTDHVNGLQKDEHGGQHDLRVFSHASVMAATCNLSKENKLGEGGFGPVYKGKLITGREIAVKRLSRCSGQGASEFQNELILISELQHANLIQLLGFCIHGEERMLIYEYMPNRSLDYFLFDSTRSVLLDWKTRFSIIEGIAQGLLYLHRYSRLRVIHRDLKASNILLDEYMNPKISDFGMARIFMHNELEANTKRVVGTYGYMSPEYAMEGIFSIKSDVYSFGVLMLEIISGRKSSSFNDNDRVLNIVGYAWKLWKEGAWQELMDPKLGDSCVTDQFLRCIHVGLLCVEEEAADRPTMSDVISMLTNESKPLALPTKPAFSLGRKVVLGAGIGGKESETISANGLSISDFDVR